MSGWRKSSYSGGGNTACVEVRPGRTVGVRDTKARARGRLAVSPVTWRSFVSLVKNAGR